MGTDSSGVGSRVHGGEGELGRRGAKEKACRVTEVGDETMRRRQATDARGESRTTERALAVAGEEACLPTYGPVRKVWAVYAYRPKIS